MYDFIRPDKVMIALKQLKDNNRLYSNIGINDDWLSQSLVNNNELFNSLIEHSNDYVAGFNNDCSRFENNDVLSAPFGILCYRVKANGFKIHDVPGDGNCPFFIYYLSIDIIRHEANRG